MVTKALLLIIGLSMLHCALGQIDMCPMRFSCTCSKTCANGLIDAGACYKSGMGIPVGSKSCCPSNVVMDCLRLLEAFPAMTAMMMGMMA